MFKFCLSKQQYRYFTWLSAVLGIVKARIAENEIVEKQNILVL